MIGLLAFLAYTYLVAAIPFGVAVTTLWGGDLDLRVAGSGNIGATNVARLYGWGLAIPVIALDMAKGFVPTLLAWLLWPEYGMWWAGTVALVAFIGHCFPIYLELRGGKGVATGAGAMLAIAPVPAGSAAAVWGLLLAITGRTSVAALGATAVLIGVSLWWDPSVVPVAIVLGIGIVFTHVANIQRIVRGQEAPVVRPVRWRRGRPDELTAQRVLADGPAGGTAPPLWDDSGEE